METSGAVANRQRVSIMGRVESGSDDPDNVGHLGHFFEGSSGSHPQTKLSGYDPDILVATSGVC